MKITLNGEARETSCGTLEELVAEGGIDPKGLVVERNGEIMEKGSWRETELKENDHMEFIKFVGGG